MQVIKQDQVYKKIMTIRDQKIIIDADVAELYGVETKRINEAVVIRINFQAAIYLNSAKRNGIR